MDATNPTIELGKLDLNLNEVPEALGINVSEGEGGVSASPLGAVALQCERCRCERCRCERCRCERCRCERCRCERCF